jgi:hypothetical protein
VHLMKWMSNDRSHDPAERRAGARGTPAPAATIDLEGICEYLHHFPIGARIKYYPELAKDALFDTLILACELDQHLLYANPDVCLSGTGSGRTLKIRLSQQEFSLPAVSKFHFVIPCILRKELGFSGRNPAKSAHAVTARVINDFRRGNILTLTHKDVRGQAVSLEATVVRTAILKEGFFVNSAAVFLAPVPSSFRLIDQRRSRRIPTSIQALLTRNPDVLSHRCVIQDSSENRMRVGFDTDNPPKEPIRKGDRVVLTIPSSHPHKELTYSATVCRKETDYIVLMLTGVHKNGIVRSLELIDELEFKTLLLNHSETQRSLVSRKASNY